MPLYMDIHTVDSENFSIEDVVKAHMEDLAIQDKYGVIQIKYWVNVEAKTLFCLMEGPDKESCNEVHKESHGNTACNIIEVFDNEFNLFMGKGTDINDLAYDNNGELDSGYRSILLIRFDDLTGKYGYYVNEIQQLISKFRGVQVVQLEDDIMATFISASNTILCAIAINKLLESSEDNYEYTITLSSGRPVDEEGNDLFEETKKKVQNLCKLGLSRKIYLDMDTQLLAEKEQSIQEINFDNFQIVNSDEFLFLFQLINVLENKLFNPEFKSNDFNKLLGLSKSQVYRKIKSLTGISPNQIIQELRLRKSLDCLKHNSKTISEIAFDLGFNSPTYFAKIFKKRFSITPTDYSKLS